ncbi:hypothetical protein SAMN05661008_01651 [Alkalithermobacter thermoalcaliphilus JW-YL-7 = DSM 7308]|uniref:Helicase HerA central domain-containing protein n=1 Tax=Alkalithermobacter thermoalcaliphilus JW-YL-7 = DSM 7308 TaxID=1121328 RepID=A0A150FUB9_CLOPD|nr:protein of unknown function DUF87 [[Clostridium] paradoxum JW-YL-7 = DSM 7308]SHL19867.1 hypothetical protein SAMN05661008_01651 [[Clostridium] paradoxum JW-YL-7 = DSM 7308]
MQVVGFTTQQEVNIAGKDRPFKINEILIVQDEYQGDQLVEVYDTKSYNKYIPLSVNEGFIDSNMTEILNNIGYKVGEETIHIAKARLLVEADYPIQTGSKVRKPKFEEVKDIFVKCKKEQGLVLGEIRSTEDILNSLDDDLKDLFCIYDKANIRKQTGIPFIFDIRKMQQYPHIGIFGGSGSGKSFGIRVILEEIMKLNVPTVVFDPHFEMDFSNPCIELDAKYRDDFAGKFNVYRVGVDVGINFEELDKNQLKKLLAISSSLTDSMINVVDTLHQNKDTYDTFIQRLKDLSEGHAIGSLDKIDKKIIEAQDQIQRQTYERIRNIYSKYEKTCPAASVNGIIWRLNRLYHEGIFGKDITFIEDGLRKGKLVVIQGDMRLIKVFSTYVLNKLYLKRREYKDCKSKHIESEFFPPFIIVTDEAHNFAPKGQDAPSKGIIKEIAQEGRKYGVFLILATQRPNLLDETVTAQLNTKFVFRTVRGQDISIIKEETDITSEESKRLPYLKSGDSFVSSAIMGRTIPIRIRMAKTTSPHTENPFEEFEQFIQKSKNYIYENIKESFPIREMQIPDIVLLLEKKDIKISAKNLIDELERLVEDGKISKEEGIFGVTYNKID